ncbi:uncharacterized protein Triagg1_10804 [Trichoderma aggressivum f. europaeum]|uniref:Nephrocystin 3-like N-terminal domain-containing protein n=1 Tax=Trichoderma aggressivum f. europaeum TaxID=173218 RepID=A0AAE1LXU4_9HYPO|nr:hypothetical protein Triagg1_10804 [Trichoderma aggressivum f. europaeum]
MPIESGKGSSTGSSSLTPGHSEKENYSPKPKQTPTVGSYNSSNYDAAITDGPDSIASSSDISASAYRKAWSSLSEDQRKELTGEDEIRKLFEQLKQTDQKHGDQCLLRKGLRAVSPYLERLRITIDFISPFASVEPTAGTALGLIKSVNSIAIAICGAADDITGHIESFLERIPAIERCNEVVNGRSRMLDIYNALVNVYKDLLQFYHKSVVMFKKSGFIIHVAMDWLKPELSGIISSFNAHADVLSKLLESESFATVQEIKDEQVDTLSDQETTKLGNIYRSLLWQLLKRKPDLKACFSDWYKKTESQSQVNPTQSDDKLRDFLYDAVSSSNQLIFIVLDGLDECEVYPRIQLRSLFHDLFKHNARLKVFISSRYDDDIESALPPAASRIELGLSKERDRIIANYLASQINIPEDTREKVVDVLSAKANGCAIWLRISLEYIGKLRIQNQKGLESALNRLPSSKSLAELYWTLFDKICSGFPENEDNLQRALETLAVARRPLTADELAYAVFIDIDDDTRTTLGELDQIAHSVKLLDLIRPFVSIINVRNGKDLQLRLVHQSLKELVLQAPPSSWSLVGRTNWQNQAVQRRAELNGSLLRRCIKYLLFEECGENNLSSGFRNRPDVEFLAIGGVLDNDEFPTESPWLKSPRDFDPSNLGLGGFFTYAAPYWTAHFPDASQKLWPDPTDLIVLCSRGSQRLENWVEQWQRPNCSYTTEFSFPEVMSHLDPLVVTAMFGPVAYMADLLKCNLQTPDFLPDSVWIAVKHLIRRNSISTIDNLLKDKDLGSTLCCAAFFYEVVLGWSEADRLCGNTAKEWEDIFDFLIRELHENLLDDGNEILCQAARNGCFVLVKKLFEAAERDPDLRRAILAKNRSKRTDWQNSISTHQSIGEAAYEAHANIVHFLCQQAGTEPHLRHINQRGQTVFHQAARSGHVEIFQTLIQRWPEGINLRNNANDTPLVELIFNSPRGDIETIETVRVILSMGKADATGLNDDPGYSPLCTAVRRANIALCRTLILEGSADISCAVSVEEETGKPFLKKDVNTQETLGAQEKMLKELCSLLPLAVSTEYLF